ncbi:SRPBCC family protein [Streptomyces sp. 8N706]|uniref:SRPBCC family protein n=1 Tax=Streptomyces sp. 8N706 TaxID=3457416 RepID=UPI003FD37690
MAKSDQDTPAEGASGLDRLREEFTNYLEAQAQRMVEGAGEKLTDLVSGLGTGAGGGVLPAVGKRVLSGESPVKALVGEKAKSAKDTVVGKVKEKLGGGGGRKPSDVKVTNIVEVLDIGLPLRTVYNHWTQFEDFSSFMKGVRSVSQSDEIESDWKLKVGPSNRSWHATVLEQVPDERIMWTSEGAKGTTRGDVSFHELAPRLTRIVVVVEYYPSGFFEKTGNLWRAQGRRLRLDLKLFQRYVTLAAEEDVEGWRGEIRDSEVVRSHEEVLEEEEREREEAGEEAEEGEEEEPEEEEEEEEGEAEEEEEPEEEEEGEYEGEEEEEEEEEEEPEGEYEEEEEE